MTKKLSTRDCQWCKVSFTYPTPQGLGIAWNNHKRSLTHRNQLSIPHDQAWKYVGDAGQLFRYGYDKYAEWLIKHQGYEKERINECTYMPCL